jgi:hypothetical protein
MAHITEKRLYAVSPQPLIANGTTNGRIEVTNACNLFVVGQIVILKSSTQQPARYKIKRIPDDVTVVLGPEDKPIQNTSDVSAYLVVDSATIESDEQNRPSVPEQEIERITYAEEPTVARRVILVDSCGTMIGPDNPLPVDAVLNIGSINIDIDAKSGDNIAISGHPAPIFSEAANSLTVAGYQQIFSYVSTNANTRIVYINVAISTNANVRVKINGIIKREYRTNAVDRQAEFIFYEHRPLPLGTTISVEAEAEKFLSNNAPYSTFTALEGYIA